MNKVFFILLLSTPFSLCAQSSVKSQKIRELMEISGSGKLGVQVIQTMLASYEKTYPDVDKEFWEEVSKEFDADQLIKMIIPIYDKHFSEKEIDEMVTFYKSSVGKKLVSQLPSILTESMQAGEKWGREVGEKVMQRLKGKGYLKG